MTDKFINLPTEKDTKILFRSPMRWGDLDIVYEKWYWDGITAESIVFLTENVKELDDESLEADVRDGPLVRQYSKVTIARGDEFTFINFNFVS